ncbi:hypothetical protein CLV58_12944 [Spirosoma oryzae]|uniref:Alcohol dehydrogenase-like protein n=1 Tax=Spirosoma oryzae TaxID=1469603 RepID=A0A2T0S562_9BACT|nr:hypothetical protein [Spirosoma oryzae]PRY28565.1 hypothetical protein CLV58_12944 [Spirosoma oryzae]
MKAAVLAHYGSPDQLVIKDADVVKPEEGQVLIRNRASSVNPADIAGFFSDCTMPSIAIKIKFGNKVPSRCWQ